MIHVVLGIRRFNCRHDCSNAPNQAYDLVNPKTGKVYPFNPNRVWGYIPESMNKLIEDGRVFFPEDTSKRPMFKRFKNELKSNSNPFSTLMLEQVGLNTEATRTIQQLMGGNVFDYSKPVSLLTSLIPQVCSGANDIILDFFAGSCVTAHAVLNLNKEDGGNRKFIMVQLPEPCEENSEAYKAGYKTIADIGKERIRRVIKKIEEKQAAKVASESQRKLFGSNEEQPRLDLGFKLFKLNRSNFKVWDGSNTDASEEEITRQLELFINHIDPSATQEDILYELLLKAGFMLTEKVEKRQMAGKTVFSISEGALLICLEEEITRELIDAVAEAEPMQFICLDRGFRGNDQLKANAVQTFAARNQGWEIVFRTV